MVYNDLLVEKEDAICKVTINRESSRNAIRPHTWEELHQLVDDVETDKNIRVVILRGAGKHTFAAGADLRHMQERTPKDILDGTAAEALLKMELSEVVFIAAINGFALGGGCELALACDIRIAAEHAKFGQPEVNLSLIPAGGATQRLPRIVGEGFAKDLILSGKIIDAQEALHVGLVTEVCESDQINEAAYKKATDIIRKGPLAVKFSKKILNADVAKHNEGYMLEKLFQSYLVNSEDTKEGIAAFLEKRAPTFKGK